MKIDKLKLIDHDNDTSSNLDWQISSILLF